MRTWGPLTLEGRAEDRADVVERVSLLLRELLHPHRASQVPGERVVHGVEGGLSCGVAVPVAARDSRSKDERVDELHSVFSFGCPLPVKHFLFPSSSVFCASSFPPIDVTKGEGRRELHPCPRHGPRCRAAARMAGCRAYGAWTATRPSFRRSWGRRARGRRSAGSCEASCGSPRAPACCSSPASRSAPTRTVATRRLGESHGFSFHGDRGHRSRSSTTGAGARRAAPPSAPPPSRQTWPSLTASCAQPRYCQPTYPDCEEDQQAGPLPALSLC